MHAVIVCRTTTSPLHDATLSRTHSYGFLYWHLNPPKTITSPPTHTNPNPPNTNPNPPTPSLTLITTNRYAFTRWVYQDGAFASLNFRGFHPTGNGLCWIPPVLSFPILIGFGLDYHIFLLSRIVDFRLRRFSDRAAIV